MHVTRYQRPSRPGRGSIAPTEKSRNTGNAWNALTTSAACTGFDDRPRADNLPVTRTKLDARNLDPATIQVERSQSPRPRPLGRHQGDVYPRSDLQSGGRVSPRVPGT